MTRPLPFHALLIVVLLVGCSPTAPPQDAAESSDRPLASHAEVARSMAEQATTLSVVGNTDQPAPTVNAGQPGAGNGRAQRAITSPQAGGPGFHRARAGPHVQPAGHG